MAYFSHNNAREQTLPSMDKSDEEWERQDNILKTITKQPLFEGIRKCEICGCEKPISEFSYSHMYRCKTCQSEIIRNTIKEIKK